jgi:hypothetical protein
MYLEFAFLQGCHVHGEQMRQAMRPMTPPELDARQIGQARLMRGMSEEELSARYGDSLLNQECYRPSHLNSEGL